MQKLHGGNVTNHGANCGDASPLHCVPANSPIIHQSREIISKV